MKTKKTQPGAPAASRHPILSNFLRYYLITCIFVGACFWFVPTQPLIPEDAEVAKIVIYHNEVAGKASGIVQTPVSEEPVQYAFTAEDEVFTQIMDLLESKSCRRTFRGLFGSQELSGTSELGYMQDIIVYDASGKLSSYMTCDGNGKVLKYRIHSMSKSGQQEMMEALRAIYE